MQPDTAKVQEVIAVWNSAVMDVLREIDRIVIAGEVDSAKLAELMLMVELARKQYETLYLYDPE